MAAPVLLLNGSPSAGKTTLAAALHEAIPGTVFWLSLDEFRRGVREQLWRGEVATLFGRLMRAYLRAIEAVSDQGVAVLAEAVMVPANEPDYRPLRHGRRLTVVGVRCPLAVAQAREARRPDRLHGPIDLDVAEFELVHQHDYDLEVDTAAEPTDASVARILDLIGPGWGELSDG